MRLNLTTITQPANRAWQKAFSHSGKPASALAVNDALLTALYDEPVETHTETIKSVAYKVAIFPVKFAKKFWEIATAIFAITVKFTLSLFILSTGVGAVVALCTGVPILPVVFIYGGLAAAYAILYHLHSPIASMAIIGCRSLAAVVATLAGFLIGMVVFFLFSPWGILIAHAALVPGIVSYVNAD